MARLMAKTSLIGWHICRSWKAPDPFGGKSNCGCEVAPCGMIVADNRDPDCEYHALDKTIRANHLAADCPGRAKA